MIPLGLILGFLPIFFLMKLMYMLGGVWNVGIACIFSVLLVLVSNLGNRYKGAAWSIGAYAVLGIVMILLELSGTLPFSVGLPLSRLSELLGGTFSSPVGPYLQIAYLFAFAKVLPGILPNAPDIKGTDESPSFILKAGGIFAALTVFILLTFDLIPDSHRFSDDAIVYRWAIAAVVSVVFLFIIGFPRRIPTWRLRGKWLMISGIVILFLTLGSYPFLVRTTSELWMSFLLWGVLLSPLVVVGKLLLTLGLLRALFNLAPTGKTRATADDKATGRMRPPSGEEKADAFFEMPADRSGSREYAALYKKARRNPSDIKQRLQFHKYLVKQEGMKEELLTHGRSLLAEMAKQKQSENIIEVFEDCRNGDAAFEPGARLSVLIAKQAIASGKFDLALQVMNRFDQRFPDHPLIPTTLCLCAKCLLGLGRKLESIDILNDMIARFPGDSLIPAAQSMRRAAGA